MTAAVFVAGRYSYCRLHHLRRRCAACDTQLERPRGDFNLLDVPVGTAEWLRNGAKFFASLGDDGAVAFVEWISVDLREVPA